MCNERFYIKFSSFRAYFYVPGTAALRRTSNLNEHFFSQKAFFRTLLDERLSFQ